MITQRERWLYSNHTQWFLSFLQQVSNSRLLEQKSHRAYRYFKISVMKAVGRLKQTDFILLASCLLLNPSVKL